MFTVYTYPAILVSYCRIIMIYFGSFCVSFFPSPSLSLSLSLSLSYFSFSPTVLNDRPVIRAKMVYSGRQYSVR